MTPPSSMRRSTNQTRRARRSHAIRRRAPTAGLREVDALPPPAFARSTRSHRGPPLSDRHGPSRVRDQHLVSSTRLARDGSPRVVVLRHHGYGTSICAPISHALSRPKRRSTRTVACLRGARDARSLRATPLPSSRQLVGVAADPPSPPPWSRGEPTVVFARARVPNQEGGSTRARARARPSRPVVAAHGSGSS